MRVDLKEVKQAIAGERDLVVDTRKTDNIRGLSGVVFKTGTIHEVAGGNKKIDRDSLVAAAKGQKGGGFLVQICLEEFSESEGGFIAGGIGYAEDGNSYESGSPAWQQWQAVRR